MIDDKEGLLYSPHPPIAYSVMDPKGYRFGIGRELSSEGRLAWWNLYWLSDPAVDRFLDDAEARSKEIGGVSLEMVTACAEATKQNLGKFVLGDLLITLKPTELIQRVKDNPHSHLAPYKLAGEAWVKTIEERSRLSRGVLSKTDGVVYANFGKNAADLIVEDNHRDRLAGKQRNIATKLRKQSSWLKLKENVPLNIAEEFVRASAWWLTHASGPVRAPNHADRIYKSTHGWAVDFGANTFLVGKAIERCVIMLNDHIVKSAEGRPPLLPYVKRDLISAISGAVAKKGGSEYIGSYPIVDDELVFGAQAINVGDAADFVIRESGITELF